MPNTPVEVEIKGNKIIVRKNEETSLSGGDIITQGVPIKHKSGRWIIAENESEMNAEEIGGCSGGPIPIDFDTMIIEWC
jgi:hypothetical protein